MSHSGEYIQDAVRTESKPDAAMVSRLSDHKVIRLLHAAIGKATEAGELLDALKKYIFYGKSLDVVNILEEVGDGHWYDAIIVDTYGVNFEEIWAKNIAKLRARYPEKFTAEAAVNRDLVAERAELEKLVNAAKEECRAAEEDARAEMIARGIK